MALDRIDGLRPPDAGAAGNTRIKEADSRSGAQGFTLLKDEMEGVIYEPEGSRRPESPKTLAQVQEEMVREEAAAARANLHSRFDGPGVTVELSPEGVAAESRPANSSIGEILRDAWRSIVSFFAGIWNGGQETVKTAGEEPDAGEEDGPENEVKDLENVDLPPRPDRTMQADPSPLERSNSPEAVAAFMVDYGGGHLAKNSDLLTKYDRRGNIVTMDPSEKRKILHSNSVIRHY